MYCCTVIVVISFWKMLTKKYVQNQVDKYKWPNDSQSLAQMIACNLHWGFSSWLFQLPLIVPNAPIKINFEVIAVVDPDDGLQPSDLTPETANVRVMILKSNQVSMNQTFITEWILNSRFSFQQAKPILAATIAMPTPEIFQEDIY